MVQGPVGLVNGDLMAAVFKRSRKGESASALIGKWAWAKSHWAL